VSLIDDALKRIQEAGQEGEEGRAERPWVPTPMPDAGLARRRRLGRRLGIAGAVLAAAAAGAFVLLHRAPETRREAAAAPALQPSPAPSPLPAVASPAPAPDEAAGKTEATTSAAARAPRSAPAAESAAAGESGAAAAPAPDRPGGTARAEEARPPAPGRPHALSDGASFASEVVLPEGRKIELGGIVYSETEPRVLLNDRILAVGDYVEGFTVSGIEPDRVALERDGLTIYLLLK
jgi:hypothetical protein